MHSTRQPASHPDHPPAINWKIAAFGAFAVVASAAFPPVSLPSLAVDAAAVAVVSLSQRWPRQAGAGLVVLFLIASADESLRSPVLLFSAPALVAAAAYSGRPRWSIAFALVLGYISVTSPFNGRWVPYDITGTLIYIAALAAAFWVGCFFRRQRLISAAQQRLLEEEMEKRREELTRALHDSVATTLTSVVMRAETLGLSSPADSEQRRTLGLIADETRQAMQEVRHLLAVMRDGGGAEQTPIERTIGEQISVTARLLRSHGFDVRCDERAVECGYFFPAGFEHVFTELATNAIKYAAPGAPVELRVARSRRGVHCAVINEVGGGAAASHLSSGMGLEEARRVVEKHGGRWRARPKGRRWVAEFDLPAHALYGPTPAAGGDFRTKPVPRGDAIGAPRGR
ncbi:sensor histidine kinase [Corynebacterium auris]|uniref:sensor histidine kinase n=1 Tax=Corynebacterium auris TaxID=44750 RepID=UPI0025B4385A|nr:HAMP domain-containing sensor histidine kinase [Corynebacterium auris]WJY67969.1 Histidine kinase [Corynebacterium auris]